MESLNAALELLNAYKAGNATDAERRYLEVMLFQYGRYLTIESSRETPVSYTHLSVPCYNVTMLKHDYYNEFFELGQQKINFS